MRYRKLRIAWSAMCGVICALLIVLWVRSYSVFGLAGGAISSSYLISFISTGGKLEIAISLRSTSELARPQSWGVSTYPQATTHTYPAKAMYMTVPHWLAILSTIGLSTVPWYASHFSLRTLLMAITLVAVVMGLIVWRSQ